MILAASFRLINKMANLKSISLHRVTGMEVIALNDFVMKVRVRMTTSSVLDTLAGLPMEIRLM